jgi:hypothetical protein
MFGECQIVHLGSLPTLSLSLHLNPQWGRVALTLSIPILMLGPFVSLTNVKLNISGSHLVPVYYLMLHSCAFSCPPTFPYSHVPDILFQKVLGVSKPLSSFSPIWFLPLCLLDTICCFVDLFKISLRIPDLSFFFSM